MSTATLTFEYVGRDGSGKPVKGRVDASNESAVINRLRSLGVAPTAIKEVSGATGINRDINLAIFEKSVGLKDLAIMSRQLSTMIGAGLTLLQALTILAEQSKSKKLSTTLTAVRNSVETGTSFSDSLYKHQNVFPPLMINLIRAGETGGFLDKALESVAMNYEKEVKLRNTIKSALTYPVIVLIMSLVAVLAMLIFIVPVFKKMFTDLGSPLPVPTQMLVTISGNMPLILAIVVPLGVAFFFWWRKNKNTEKVRQFVDPLRLKIPVFGQLTAKIAIARFTRNFATMVSSGVPILRSLSIVGETSGNYVIERALHKVEDSVRVGRSIAGPLALEPIFPSMVTQMIAVGEDSGSLEHMLNKVSDFYDDEVQATTEALTSLIEPLMLAFLGVVVGGMIVSLYLPIFGIIGAVNK
jgi:type IV pilus assembly protein PilC